MLKMLEEKDWNILLKRIKNGRCTPFLGYGACSEKISVIFQIANEWAEEYDYPMEESYDLARVAQFVAAVEDLITPKEEVCNAFIWRQQDATRNAIQMVGQANFSHKQLQNKNCKQIQEMLFQEKEINFNDLPTYQKRGVCVVKETYMKDEAQRTRWVVDKDIPVFTQDRGYIEKYLL
jgi:hypothetical protein